MNRSVKSSLFFQYGRDLLSSRLEENIEIDVLVAGRYQNFRYGAVECSTYEPPVVTTVVASFTTRLAHRGTREKQWSGK